MRFRQYTTCNLRTFIVILLLILIRFPSIGTAATYYVDATNGYDANNGLTPEKAWKTINKVNNSIFVPGDSILFKRGKTWREQLTVPFSGSQGSPITFGAYGTGPKPIINGADLVVPWEHYAGYTNVWKAACAGAPSQVYFNSSRGTRVTSVSLCNATNKWYWASNVLYIYSASDPDTAYVTPGIEAAVRTQTILLDGKTHIKLENLDCQKSAASTAGSIYLNNSNPAILDNLDLSNNDACAGIYVRGTGNASLIKNCSVSFTRHTTADRGAGILIDGIGRGHIVQDCTISHNTSSGIKEKLITASDFLTIQRNTVYQNGAAGISINGDGSSPDGCIIQNNIVYSNGQAISDYWGIDLYKVGDNNIVRYNIVHDHHYISVSSGGIRFDAQPGGVFGLNNQISYNLIYNERCGIEIGGASAFTIYNNTIYNSSEVGLAITNAETTSGTIKNNILHTASSNIIQNLDATNVLFDNNCYFPVSVFFRWNTSKTNFATWKTNCSGDANSLNSDPLMVNPAVYDFHLQATSPCINAGADVELTHDYEGNSIQGLPDIGAFEFSDGTASLTASATASPTTGQAPLTVQFIGEATGGILPYSYSWNFGDGQSSSLQNPYHIFYSVGTYDVVLEVTDNRSASDTASLSIIVTSPGDNDYVLSISSATGSPAPDQGGTTEPSPGNYSYAAGSYVLIKSIANQDYRFSRWADKAGTTIGYAKDFQVLMDNPRSVSANFCVKCGDVTGDLKISPADAQKAFDIYLKRIQDPTMCELENADVNCSGTPTDPKITPADAQTIFNKFLEKADLPPGDCSGFVRTGTSAYAESLGISQTGEVRLVIDEMEAGAGKDILVPILVDSSFPISAFGFDFAFPSDILAFMGIERTYYTERFDQIAANPISEGVVRAGGYTTQPLTARSPAALVILVFRVIGGVQTPISFSIINSCDDLRQAQIRTGIIRRPAEKPREGRPWVRRTNGKSYDF